MAKIVVAGCSDCPYFAKVELLADNLKINVPNFHVHKIVKTRKEWNAWAIDICKFNNWNIKESPIIWRELVDRGGKGHLIGGANEFQEYVKCYYNIISDFTSNQMQNIAQDNVRFKNEEDKENREFKALSTPTKVCIAGAINDAVPHFVLSLAQGSVINSTTELSIVFLDKSANLSFLKSLQMGTFDLAYPLVRSISITDDYEAAFIDSSIIVIFDEIIKYSPEQWTNHLKEQQEYYEYLGTLIEKYCPIYVKVLLVPSSSTNFINVNLISIHRMLQRIPKFQVVGLARTLEQHVRSVISKRLSVNPSNVHNIVVWGNLGGKTFFDLKYSRVHRYDGSVMGPEPFSIPVEKAIWDKKWLKNEIDKLIEARLEKIYQLRGPTGNSLALSTAVSSFLKQWINGDDNGYIHSLAVASEGWYGVPEGVVFSMPVTLNPKGYWTVVQDFELSEFQFKKINECVEDLNQKIQILYPWMNNNALAEMVIDEAFIDCQINSLLLEIYPKNEISQIQSLINSSLSPEEKIEISRSKDLLVATVEELQKSKTIEEIRTEENSRSDQKSDREVIGTSDTPHIDTEEDNDLMRTESSENVMSNNEWKEEEEKEDD